MGSRGASSRRLPPRLPAVVRAVVVSAVISAMPALIRFVALCFILAQVPPADAARLALVIGNRDYIVGALKNPANDAAAMGAALKALGFQVTLVRNLRRDDIGSTVDGFTSKIGPGDDVVVFYAGHGMQVKGVNYLPAIDASIRSESDVALNSINLSQLLDRLDEAKAGVRLLLVDACRDNPFARTFRSASRGLARVEGAPTGTLLHFATRPGGVADDGVGANGLYTTHLLRHLRTPGLPVESMLKRVASDVRQASGGSQQPWTEGALDGEFFFSPQLDLAPQGTGLRPLKQGQDCSDCPEMVAIPAGSFEMGSRELYDDEKPVHRVSVRAFMMSRTEVTQGQWKSLMGSNPSGFSNCGDDCPVDSVTWTEAKAYVQKLSERTGKAYRLPSEAEWEYAARAGTSTQWVFGDDPTLLSNHAWFGGIGRERTSGNSSSRVHPVARKEANAFGLFDMAGNVWEWVEDVWHASYEGAPRDGSAWVTGGNEATRVLRGGSWYDHPRMLKSSSRGSAQVDYRIDVVGFRVVLSL